MFHKKAIPAAAVLVASGLVLAACGRSAEPGDTMSPQPSDTGTGPVTGELNIWAQGGEGEHLPEFKKQFEAENPGITINVTAIPWDAAHAKYQTAIAGGTAPDIAQMGTTWMGDFADGFVPTPSNIDTSGFFSGSVASTIVHGVAYGVPWSGDTRVLYYRTDLAEKAGVTTPPTTFEDFKALAKAYQTKAGAKWGVELPAGGRDSVQAMMWIPWSNGADLMNADQSKWTFDTPEFVDALTYYQSFFTEGIANPNPETGAGSTESAFVDGSIPMFIGSPGQIQQLEAAGGADFGDKYAVAMVPAGANGTSTSFVGGSNLVVFKDSKNQAAAWKFIEWLSQKDIQLSWRLASGDLPLVKTAWEDPALADDEKMTVIGEQLNSSKSPPQISTWTEVGAAADTILEQIVKAGADPATAVKSLQATADSIGIGS